tara:strand:+ start:3734 stop:3967 length:234 start_codon:yes stop_codon:yes gene_type:complete
LVKNLKNNVMKINFTKLNGETRIMNCTLHESVLPESTGKSERKENPDVLSVWDIDKNAWRSFRLDSVNEMKVIEGVL